MEENRKKTDKFNQNGRERLNEINEYMTEIAESNINI